MLLAITLNPTKAHITSANQNPTSHNKKAETRVFVNIEDKRKALESFSPWRLLIKKRLKGLTQGKYDLCLQIVYKIEGLSVNDRSDLRGHSGFEMGFPQYGHFHLFRFSSSAVDN
jgi:hypothetical protein